MLGRIFTVGGYTLLSRVTGFARDIMLAAILGAGPVADAFFVALRLPNHFRAIFAEGNTGVGGGNFNVEMGITYRVTENLPGAARSEHGKTRRNRD